MSAVIALPLVEASDRLQAAADPAALPDPFDDSCQPRSDQSSR